MLRNRTICILITAAVLGLTGCSNSFGHHRTEAGSGNPDTPAGKAGKVAYNVGKETEKAAKEAERKLDKAAHDAQAGWNDAKKSADH